MASKKQTFAVQSTASFAGHFLFRAPHGRYIDLTKDISRAQRFESPESAQEHGRRYFSSEDQFSVVEIEQCWRLVGGR